MIDQPTALRPRLGRALGADTEAEAAEFEATAAAVLATLATPVAPSASMKAALFARLDEVPSPGPALHLVDGQHAVPRRGRPVARVAAARPAARRRRLGLVGGLAAAAMLVVAGIGAGFAVNRSQDHGASTAYAAVASAPDAQRTSAVFSGGSASVRLVSSVSLGRSVVVVSGAPAVGSGKVYELWLVRDGKATAAGSFTSGSSRVVVPLTGRYEAHDVVAATVESTPTPSHPTTPPVFELPA
ncbi:anti-sigma factor [Frondihabitans australicus]|uniref:Anti-sigma-K factor rskA n=1 Tax=Frondihabitans australicus TaxID=386892 RepID=A0A495IBJ9_9MICO|nr:anti-sigma factor [Frondihabitans australicus]RKR73377.1 anti-sigma-K factor rskA [Frondihabitans australicus]